MTAALEDDVQQLQLSADEDPTVNGAKSTAPDPPTIVNAAVVGEWEDAIKAYKGPKLNKHAIECPSWYAAERLDHLFRTSEWRCAAKSDHSL